MAPLFLRLHEALACWEHPWEVVAVDDGSTDDTLLALKRMRSLYGPHVRIIELSRNFGQTQAMQAGVDAAMGEVIVTLDGDLQNDPADIPRMVRRLLQEDLDLVAGWRENREDGLLFRKLPSFFANALIRWATGLPLHDSGCTLKVFRAQALKSLHLVGEMHRLIPAWLLMQTKKSRIAEEPVCHHPRTRGYSKYGLSRTFRVALDLLSVYFFGRYLARPGHFFGAIGFVFGGLGGIAWFYLFLEKLQGHAIGARPLLWVAMVLLVVGTQFLTTGVLAELLSRIYFASSQSRAYVIRQADGGGIWHDGQNIVLPKSKDCDYS